MKLKSIRYHPQINPNTQKNYERRLKHLEKELKETKDLLQSVLGVVKNKINYQPDYQHRTSGLGFCGFHSNAFIICYLQHLLLSFQFNSHQSLSTIPAVKIPLQWRGVKKP